MVVDLLRHYAEDMLKRNENPPPGEMIPMIRTPVLLYCIGSFRLTGEIYGREPCPFEFKHEYW